MAAKTQNIFTWLGEYIARSISALFNGPKNDIVFNDYLTKEHFEARNFSSCNWYTRANKPVLLATYRKFTENTTTSYTDSFTYSTLTVIDFNDEGEIEEQRVYKDDFENFETGVDEFFSDTVEEHSITNIDTGQESSISFDPDLPFTHFENLTWRGQTWGPDNLPVKYDSLRVIGDGYDYNSNAFEQTIILRIPNRYSLYNDFGRTSRKNTVDDGWAEFEASGLFIKPMDGKVYYTSDAELFVEGKAKTDGFYFYVDSDNNNFYETVYILSNTYRRTDYSGLLEFNVMAIGYNYDGINDFAPYESLDQTKSTVSGLDNLAHESTMFGTDWVYNFNRLQDVKLLWEEESPLEKLGLKPKDQIFEIYSLVEQSQQNRKFSTLFYDIRHETYSTAWEQYRKQLEGDIVQQVFMCGVAAVMSAAVKWIPGIGEGLGKLNYFLTYTLLTKLYIDTQIHNAQSQSRSQTFYSLATDRREPTSLNYKAIGDRILQDSMIAALIGHPGGYYTTVSGGEPGNQYTAQALVSPPNLARMVGALNLGGFFALLWDNFWHMGESNPDVFTALDFDGLNLNYLLHTSELSSYNQRKYYRYVNTDSLINIYEWYWANTLGYLETIVKVRSNNQFDTIRPTCVDKRPQYEFVNSAMQGWLLPQQVLYRPVVLSPDRYWEIRPKSGHLVITTQCNNYGNTEGIDLYETLGELELQAGYKAKIPLNNNSFYYPINYISIDIIKENEDEEIEYFAQDLIVSRSYYNLESGNLYFNESLEKIISGRFPDFENVLNQAWMEEFLDSKVFYNIHIYFDIFVPDTTEETSDLALAQATFYIIMDYFNQYTYAEVSANMISEIAYTETVTFWSTFISIPFMLFGAETTKGQEEVVGEAGVKVVEQTLKQTFKSYVQDIVKSIPKKLLSKDLWLAPFKEIIDEIVKDGIIETLAENICEMTGFLSEDVAFWISAIGTSWRETTGAVGSLVLGTDIDPQLNMNFMNEIFLHAARNTGNTDTRNKVLTRLNQENDAKVGEKQSLRKWEALFKSSFFKGLFMLIPSLFISTFSFPALTSLNKMVKGIIQSPQVSAQMKAIDHARSKAELVKWFGKDATEILGYLKKPSNIDNEALIDLFYDKQQDPDSNQKTDTHKPPAINIAPLFDPNPHVDAIIKQLKLSEKFKEIRLNSIFKDFELFIDYDPKKIDLQTAGYEIDTKISEKTSLESKNSVGNAEEGILSAYHRDVIEYIYNEF
ncbi:MAG: hypothetical protein ACFFC7_32510, partial [Candidatus Hermodarchaeota archaeon]